MSSYTPDHRVSRVTRDALSLPWALYCTAFAAAPEQPPEPVRRPAPRRRRTLRCAHH